MSRPSGPGAEAERVNMVPPDLRGRRGLFCASRNVGGTAGSNAEGGQDPRADGAGVWPATEFRQWENRGRPAAYWSSHGGCEHRLV